MEEEKRTYIVPESEWIVFSGADDIITTSPDPDEGEWDAR